MSKLLCAILLIVSCTVQAREIELTRSNSYLLAGPINPFSMATHAATIAALSAFNGKNEAYVVIYSPGGAVAPVLFAKEALKSYKNVSVVIVMAASMAAAISQTLPGKRYIVPSGQIIFHRVRLSFDGEVTIDTAEWLRKYLFEDDRTVNHMCANRLLIPYSQYISKVTNKDWVLNASEAKQVGAVDEIVTAKCSPTIRALNIRVLTYSPYSGLPVPQHICDLIEKE